MWFIREGMLPTKMTQKTFEWQEDLLSVQSCIRPDMPATLCTGPLTEVVLNTTSIWGPNGGHIIIITGLRGSLASAVVLSHQPLKLVLIFQWTVFTDILSTNASADPSSQARAKSCCLVVPRQQAVNTRVLFLPVFRPVVVAPCLCL